MIEKLKLLMHVASDVKTYLVKDDFYFYHGGDYAYVEFKIEYINSPRELLGLCRDLPVRFLPVDGEIGIRIFVEFDD